MQYGGKHCSDVFRAPEASRQAYRHALSAYTFTECLCNMVPKCVVEIVVAFQDLGQHTRTATCCLQACCEYDHPAASAETNC